MTTKRLFSFLVCCSIIVWQLLVFLKYLHYPILSKIVSKGFSNDTSSYHVVHTIENQYKGIFGEVRHMDVQYNYSTKVVKNSIAIGMAITSQKAQWDTPLTILKTFPFFKTFISSFCKTVSDGYDYNFFFAYDRNDSFFSNESNTESFSRILLVFTDLYCTNGSRYSVHFIKCAHNGEPTRAQNDAMMEAYMSNMEYYFRINDDTRMNTPHWTEQFINTLRKFDPPNIGVAGPSHSGGNLNILTYDFVHMSHINIHGLYYPRIFKDWFADDWITYIYRPYRSVKVDTVKVQHTLEIGTRYDARGFDEYLLSRMVQNSARDIQRYINTTKSAVKPTGDKIVSIALAGRNPRHTYGAIRNAQLVQMYFPGWTLRVYIPPASPSYSHIIIPKVVSNKLIQLGAELVYVKPALFKLHPSLWKYLVIDNHDTVNYFIVKNTENRVSERDHLLMQHWMKINNSSACLCVKELHREGKFYFMDTLLGGHNPKFKNVLGRTNIEEILTEISLYNGSPTHMTEQQFLQTYIWPRLKANLCYNNSGFYRNRTLTIPSHIKKIKSPGFNDLYNEFDQIRSTKLIL